MAEETRVAAHLATEAEWNDSPFGLVVESTGQGKSLSKGVWQMGSNDCAVLNIRLGKISIEDSLKQPEKSLGNWRSRLRDLWNIAGVADQNTGLPSVTSHYGYFMTAWHIPLALSGQQADLPNGVLAFVPRVTAPYALPVLLPGKVGLLSASSGVFTLELTAGNIDLLQLTVDHCSHAGPVSLRAGQKVEWKCGSVVRFV